MRVTCTSQGLFPTSRGEIFSPPRLMSSLRRPVSVRKPSSSKKPWSPVWNQPPAALSMLDHPAQRACFPCKTASSPRHRHASSCYECFLLKNTSPCIAVQNQQTNVSYQPF